MTCADFGHGCRLSARDDWLLTLVSFPISVLPDDLLLHVFGPGALLPTLLLNSISWGIAVVLLALLLDRFRKKL